MFGKNNLYNISNFCSRRKSENRYRRKERKYVSVLRKSVLLLILALLLNSIVWMGHRMLLQRGIADEVLRFHVLANSDSETDQAVKLKVRDAVLVWLSDSEALKDSEQKENRSEISMENAWKTGKNSSKKTENNNQKATEEAFLRAHLKDLETVANHVLASDHLSYQAHASLTTCYFPSRTYGSCTFPPGWYKALRIELGKAKGHNWWCVLYPRLCFTDSLHAVVKEDEMQQLSDVLTEAEYDSLLHEPSKWKLTFRWF